MPVAPNCRLKELAMSAHHQQSIHAAPVRAADHLHEEGFVTLTLGGMLCGVPVLAVREVVTDSKIVRGRIVTAIDTRCRLGLEPAPQTAERVALVAEMEGALYALLIDQVLEVLSLRTDQIEETPSNLSATWQTYSKGVYRLSERLMVVLDIERLLALPS
jgi:purine-binding chemotaxis protein CheW